MEPLLPNRMLFFYAAQADEGSLFGLLSVMDELGLPVVQIIPVAIPASGGLIGGNGQAQMAIRYNVLTKCKASEYKGKLGALSKHSGSTFLERGPMALFQEYIRETKQSEKLGEGLKDESPRTGNTVPFRKPPEGGGSFN